MRQSNTLINFVLGGCLALLLVGQAHATKMYKIVDEKGRVTFSQFPPTQENAKPNQTVETQTIDAKTETSVTVEGADQYCGDIRLPRMREDEEWYFSEVNSQKRYWKKELEREQRYLNKQQRNYSKYSNSNYRIESMKEKGESIRNLRCAINWASTHKEDIDQAKGQREDELGRLQVSLEVVNNRRDDNCGKKPLYDPADTDNRQRLKSWSKCNKSYKYHIRKLERLIRTEKDKLVYLK